MGAETRFGFLFVFFLDRNGGEDFLAPAAVKAAVGLFMAAPVHRGKEAGNSLRALSLPVLRVLRETPLLRAAHALSDAKVISEILRNQARDFPHPSSLRPNGAGEQLQILGTPHLAAPEGAQVSRHPLGVEKHEAAIAQHFHHRD